MKREKLVVMNVWLTADQKKFIGQQAKKLDETQSFIVRKIIDYYIANN